MKEAHLDSKLYDCEKCSKTLTGARSFYNHRRVHKTFQCPKCGKNLVIDNKAGHLRRCQGIKVKIKRCQHESCDYTTERMSSFKAHMVSHRQLFCDVKDCGKEFYGKRNLDTHKRKLQKKMFTPKIRPKKEPKVHGCGWCSYITTVTTNLRNHEESCKAKNSNPPIIMVI